MAAPASYTESTLANFMHVLLGRDELAAALHWSIAEGDYTDAVDETMLVYDVADITTVSGRDNIRKLRAIARAEVWRLVVARTVHRHQRGMDASARSEHQIWDHANAMFEQARQEAIALGVTDYDMTQKPTAVKTTIARRGMEVD